jgi:flavin reductase (DIM6/NTAB) family NADH-FMN oxidoreductase RutF
VVESPISFECREVSTVNLGVGKNIVLGEVLLMHIRDELIDMEKLYVDTPAARLIGRMHGAGWYARTTELFEMPRVADNQASDLIRKLHESKANR